MSYGLLWVEWLAVALIWLAAIAAVAARFRRRWLGRCLTALAAMIPLLFFAVFAAAEGYVKFVERFANNWFIYAASLLLFDFVGTIIICIAARKSELWLRGKLFVALLAGVAMTCMTVWNMELALQTANSERRFEAAEAALAMAPPGVPDDQNAALVYQEAMARVMPDAESDAIDFGQPMNPSDPAMVAFMKRQAGTIDLARKAGEMPLYRLDINYANPDLTLLIQDFQGERALVSLLRRHEQYELALGDINSAVRDQAAMLALARHLANQPLLISVLLAYGIEGVADRGLHELLPAITNPGQLSGLNTNPDWARQILRHGLESENSFTAAKFDAWMGGEWPSMPKGATPAPVVEENRIQFGPLVSLFIMDGEYDAYRQSRQQIEWCAGQPYYTVKSRLDAISHSPGGIFAGVLIPSLARSCQTAAHMEANDAAALIAVAATKFRLDHGHLPADFDQLTPACLDSVPTDPFDGKPMKLQIANGKWIVYSVGPTGKLEDDIKLGDYMITLPGGTR
jgi:hypothetical protein